MRTRVSVFLHLFAALAPVAAVAESVDEACGSLPVNEIADRDFSKYWSEFHDKQASFDAGASVLGLEVVPGAKGAGSVTDASSGAMREDTHTSKVNIVDKQGTLGIACAIAVCRIGRQPGVQSTVVAAFERHCFGMPDYGARMMFDPPIATAIVTPEEVGTWMSGSLSARGSPDVRVKYHWRVIHTQPGLKFEFPEETVTLDKDPSPVPQPFLYRVDPTAQIGKPLYATLGLVAADATSQAATMIGAFSVQRAPDGPCREIETAGGRTYCRRCVFDLSGIARRMENPPSYVTCPDMRPSTQFVARFDGALTQVEDKEGRLATPGLHAMTLWMWPGTSEMPMPTPKTPGLAVMEATRDQPMPEHISSDLYAMTTKLSGKSGSATVGWRIAYCEFHMNLPNTNQGGSGQCRLEPTSTIVIEEATPISHVTK